MAIQFTYPRKNNPDSSDLLLIADSQNYWRTRQITIEDIAAAVIPGGYTLPTASTVVLGGVRIDGDTINIDKNGVISVSSSTGLQNLQQTLDVGNSAASLDGNSSILMDLSNGASGYFSVVYDTLTRLDLSSRFGSLKTKQSASIDVKEPETGFRTINTPVPGGNLFEASLFYNSDTTSPFNAIGGVSLITPGSSKIDFISNNSYYIPGNTVPINNGRGYFFRGDYSAQDSLWSPGQGELDFSNILGIRNGGNNPLTKTFSFQNKTGTLAHLDDIGLKIVDEGNGSAYSLSLNDRSKNLPAGLQTVDLAIYVYTGFAKSISLTNPGSYTGVSDGTYTAGVLSQTGSAFPTNGATYSPIVEIVVVGGVITNVLLTGVEWAGFQVGDVVTLDLSAPTVITDATITIDAITNAGPGSSGTFSSGGDNISYAQAAEYGAHSMNGYGNTVLGYYGNHAIGTYNKVLNGYAFTSFGYSNWADMTGSVGMGGTMGGYNRNTESANITLGFGLTARAKGVVVVGTGNVPYTGSLTALDRPMFTVGIGDIDTSQTFNNGTVSNRANGFTVLRNGSVIADTLSKQGIDLEPNGRVLVTREWIEQTITREVPFLITALSGGSSSYSNANNTIYLSWTGGSGVYNLTLPSASDIPYRTIQIISDGTLGANDKVHVLVPVGESIDGSLNPGFYALNKPYNGVKVWSDGSNWIVTQAKAT